MISVGREVISAILHVAEMTYRNGDFIQSRCRQQRA